MDTSDFLRAAAKNMPRADEYSPLGLAWLGDAVYELLVRSKVASKGNAPADDLFKEAKGYSSAAAQSAVFNVLESHLTEEEFAVLKRGRNAKSYSRAKNANIIDYRRATAIEALFGHLFIQNRVDRLVELFDLIDNSKGAVTNDN